MTLGIKKVRGKKRTRIDGILSSMGKMGITDKVLMYRKLWKIVYFN